MSNTAKISHAVAQCTSLYYPIVVNVVVVVVVNVVVLLLAVFFGE